MMEINNNLIQDQLVKKLEILDFHAKKFVDSFNISHKIIGITELHANNFENAFFDYDTFHAKHIYTNPKVIWRGEDDYTDLVALSYRNMLRGVQIKTGHQFKKLSL